METVKGPCRSAEEEITYLVETHQLALLRLCFAYLHDQALAEDAVQETFLKAYRKLGKFKDMAFGNCDQLLQGYESWKLVPAYRSFGFNRYTAAACGGIRPRR